MQSQNFTPYLCGQLILIVLIKSGKIFMKFLTIFSFIFFHATHLRVYRRTSLYAVDRDRKIWLAYNEFAYQKTKDDYKLEDRFYK